MNRKAASKLAFILIFAVFIFGGCSETRTKNPAPSEPEDPVLQERSAKDAAFKSGGDSPILPQDKPGFLKLAYYPINPRLKFSAVLHRYPSPKQVRLGTNTGEIRSGLRYGYFDFQVEGQAFRLQAYRLEDVPDRGASLFVPFRDATSGQETYAAGRYIDLKENTSGIYDLDFNRAYNPYCAYNSEFSCPVPPPENMLTVPIRAGEKKYTAGH